MASVLLVVGGPAVYVLLLDVPYLRATGLPALVMMGAGVLLGAAAAWRRGGRVRRAIAAGNALLTAAFVYALFGYAALPQASGVPALLTAAPDFSLPDQAGRPWRLREACAAGPVLLVFYRGFW